MARLDVERSGYYAETLGGLSDESVIAVMAGAAGDADVTFVITREDVDGKLLVGLDRGRVVIGREYVGEIFQFVADASRRDGVVLMTIGGQEAEMDARYVTCPDTLAVVAREWLSATADVTGGFWERQ